MDLVPCNGYRIACYILYTLLHYALSGIGHSAACSSVKVFLMSVPNNEHSASVFLRQ